MKRNSEKKGVFSLHFAKKRKKFFDAKMTLKRSEKVFEGEKNKQKIET
jgi:hypothetical protein